MLHCQPVCHGCADNAIATPTGLPCYSHGVQIVLMEKDLQKR